jgi:hypothetical protein
MEVEGEKKEGGGGWTEGVSFTGQHEGFVNAVQWVKGDEQGQYCSFRLDYKRTLLLIRA